MNAAGSIMKKTRKTLQLDVNQQHQFLYFLKFFSEGRFYHLDVLIEKLLNECGIRNECGILNYECSFNMTSSNLRREGNVIEV